MTTESLARFDSRTRALIDFATEISYSDLPAPVLERSELVLLDTIGSLLAAANPKYDPGRMLAAFVDEIGGTPESTVVGYGTKTACVNAALANGTMGYYCDLDAHHPEAITHTPAIMVPVALAVGEREAASGRELLAAMVAGIEVTCRVSLAMNPGALYEQGFHPTPVAGSFGAAVAAGKLLELDKRQLAIALGLAQTQTSGLLAWKEEPTESFRPFNPGIAARNGTTAALLAGLDYGTPVDPFDGEYNVFRAFSDGAETVDELDRDLGESYRTSDHAFKQYSSVAFSHTGLDAMRSLLSEHDITPDEIEGIEVRFPATGAELIDDADLRSHSLRYLLAVAAVQGTVTIDDIVTDRTSDSQIASLLEAVDLVRDEELDALFPERYTSIVTLETTEGTYSERIDYAKGTPENPFDRSDVKEKFRRLTAETTLEIRQTAIIEMVSEIGQVDDVGELATLLATDTDCRD